MGRGKQSRIEERTPPTVPWFPELEGHPCPEVPGVLMGLAFRLVHAAERWEGPVSVARMVEDTGLTPPVLYMALEFCRFVGLLRVIERSASELDPTLN